jgi:hypothetical protein
MPRKPKAKRARAPEPKRRRKVAATKKPKAKPRAKKPAVKPRAKKVVREIRKTPPRSKKLTAAQVRARRQAALARELKREAEQRKKAAAKRKRREAALKGWEKRRKEARQRSERARRGWRTRHFRKAREQAVNGLRGRNARDWRVLFDLIDNEDPIWLAFLARAEELGFSSRQARDEWFSPTMG